MLWPFWALAVAAATMPAVSEARVSFDRSIAPPAPLVEAVPAPRPGYVWAPGYWTWQGDRYNWIAGKLDEGAPRLSLGAAPLGGARLPPALQHGHWQR